MNKRKLLIIIFSISFFISLIINIPAWVLGSLINSYSNNRLIAVNEHGSFWNGKATLLTYNLKAKTSAPLIDVSWKLSLGLKELVKVKFSSANSTIANVSLEKNGLNINQLNLTLGLDQLTPLLGNLNTLGLSGNANLTSSHLLISKKLTGLIDLNLSNVASAIAPINPLGSYNVSLDLKTQSIQVTSDKNSILNVNADGNLSSLTLNSKINPDYKDQLLQFMTMLGIPQADGSYQMKVF